MTWTDAVREDDPAQARDDDGGEALAALLTKAIAADTVPGAAIEHLVGLLRSLEADRDGDPAE